jgi:hypothetical protein
MRRSVFVLVAVLGLLIGFAPQPTAACGGLFCTNIPVDQAAERIIFAVDRSAGEITAYVQINYTGSPEDFSWVVPVPNNPKVGVAELASFTELSQLTVPRLIFPPQPDCFQMPVMSASGGGADSVNVLQQGSVGPYDFAVIEDDDPAVLVAWLRDNGYRITPEMEPLVKAYTDDNMVFLAMKLSGGKESQDIQPVSMTYKATEPMIPIRLTAVAANPNMGILTWVFADRQATPANMNRFLMRKNDMAMTDMFGNTNYNSLRSGVLDSVQGQGFVVEYAQPTSALQSSDPLIKELVAKYGYLTRLYGEMSPDEMTLDPMFKFDGDLANVSNTIDMTDRNSPYDCADNSIHTVRRQQIDAAKGNRLSPEDATKDLRRGPLQIISIVVVGGILLLIVWIARKPRRSNKA